MVPVVGTGVLGVGAAPSTHWLLPAMHSEKESTVL